ncbi:hypothetical protein GUJ93_ZPchr0012g20333 [Zizania palustris]|uniref:Uncharacterized protein n=1 Tax=Zizania palustris TaxID=103762 RepID=A0A8J5WHQ2_ZIZPA|nr:hypothetical protein GUJ93_ZPchr0012g20333 [Zizania palustris]
MALARLGRRNVAGPLLLLNLVMYVFMLGFAGWALNSSIADGEQQQLWPYRELSTGAAATFHFATFAALAGVLGVAAKVAAAYHARAAWKPQGLAAAASLGTVAWAATALAFGLACREIHDAARAGAGASARGWQMRTLEGLTMTLAFTQLLYVLLLHAAVAGDDRCGLASPVDGESTTDACNLM